jgi:diguanylate cyclase (GGDEF)-like protein
MAAHHPEFKKQPQSVESKVRWAIGLAMAAFVALSVVAFLSIGHYLTLTANLNGVHRVQAALSDYFSAMQDAETGQRGYLLTGDQNYLEPYEKAVREVAKRKVELEAAVAATTVATATKNSTATRAATGIHADSISALQTLTYEKLKELRHTIGLRRSVGFDAAREVVQTGQGKALMDQIRLRVAAIDDEGNAAIARLELNAKNSLERAVLLTLVTVALVIALLWLAARIIIADLREKARLAKKLTEQASRDPLTGLPNRRFFHEMARYALAQARRHRSRAAILFIDLDGFKAVNDSAGHEAGDALLVQVSERFSDTVRETDLVARLGGDEFAVLVNEVPNPQELAMLAARLLQSLQSIALPALAEKIIGASIGIAIYPEDATEASSLLRSADAAMYVAKDAGKNRYQFARHEMGAEPTRETRLRNDLARALENQEFHLVYQPIIELHGERIIGVEALLRWQHPELGNVPPDEFVPIAENAGHIVAMGAWVLATACKEARRWFDAGGDHIYVAVNVASQQWRGGEWVRLVQGALKQHQLPGRALMVEITERSLMQSEISADLMTLKTMGVRLSLDDFGTGYSALSYLKRFAIDSVKIDRSFVSGLPSDPTDAALVRAIIAMGKSLGIALIGEGAETQAQRDFLAAHDCEYAQGFWFYRPMSSEKIHALLSGDR